jgi:hypothetical protein
MPSRKQAVCLSSLLCTVFALSIVAGLPAIGTVHAPLKASDNSNLPLPAVDFAPQGKQAFASVSSFESLTLEGWQWLHGSNATVVSSENYSGEPSLMSSANRGNQIDYANKGFLTGQTSLSFQVAMHASSGAAGYVGLSSSTNNFVAVVGVRNGTVVAGSDLSSLKAVEAIPKKTAYPSGWVYIIADLSNSKGSWQMQVFVDQTEKISRQVSVPNAGKYSGALIETTFSAHFKSQISCRVTIRCRDTVVVSPRRES